LKRLAFKGARLAGAPASGKIDPSLLILVLSVAVFVLLFVFRSYDDNRLTSWSWVFEGASAWKTYLALFLSLLALYILRSWVSPNALPPWALFFLSFASASVFWSVPEVIVDASRYFTQAKHLEVYGVGYFIRQWGVDIQAWTDLPLVPFLYGLILRFFGEERVFVQAFTTLLFSLTVLLTYLLGRDIRDRETGLMAGALLMGIPYLYSQTPLMLVDVPTMFFFTLSVFTFRRAVGATGACVIGGTAPHATGGTAPRATGGTAVAVAAMVLSIFSKYSLWPLLSVLIVIMIIEKRQEPQALRRGLLVILFAVLLSCGIALYKFDVFSEQLGLLLSYQRPGLGRWSEGYISTFFFQVHPFITLAAIYSLYRAFREKDLRYMEICFPVFLLLLMGVKRIRYTVPVFPALTLMAAYGLRGLSGRLRNFAVPAVIAFSLSVAVFGYMPFLKSMSETNLKEAGEFLDSLSTEEVEVFVLPQDGDVNPAVSVPILDMHTGGRVLYNHRTFPPPPDVETSALRFTWQYRNPKYYAYDEKGPRPPASGHGPRRNITGCGEARPPAIVVVISGREGGLPEYLKDRLRGYGLKEFGNSTGVFRYETLVKVYYGP